MTEGLSVRQAQLLTLEAQGLIGNRPKSVLETVQRTNLLQIDSVNVFERAHYLPLFSRLGNFEKTELDALTGGFNPTLIEYWAHAASFIETSQLPSYRYRMKLFRDKYLEADGSWGAANAKFLDWLLAEVSAKGPLTAGEVEHDRSKRGGSWWGWSDVKRGLELLFLSGDLVSGGRRSFQRLYATPEQVLPAELWQQELGVDAAHQQLLLLAAKSFGVATADELADYHRLKFVPNRMQPNIKSAFSQLLDSGQLIELAIEGQTEKFFALPKALKGNDWAKLEKQASDRTTVLSPFDPIAWHRERAIRLYGFDYKIEIYTPAPKRIYGYYCLPILFDGALAGRIDLKSDRKPKQLLVQAAWHETRLKPADVERLATQLAVHLADVTAWQKLEQIVVAGGGNLAAALKAKLKV